MHPVKLAENGDIIVYDVVLPSLPVIGLLTLTDTQAVCRRRTVMIVLLSESLSHWIPPAYTQAGLGRRTAMLVLLSESLSHWIPLAYTPAVSRRRTVRFVLLSP